MLGSFFMRRLSRNLQIRKCGNVQILGESVRSGKFSGISRSDAARQQAY